ncbi:hypothetical protein BDN72DRAFT_622918 [Pluteus cervinus]|uniref:Uncharacterized protein n=1 Tax=Pluteus cervinus TaxID=181527 RepID=A0ACD3AUY0_9AGAR|nr:hypothetical protein BDN72DRAFT_622918 [Pluteus cervinus]
MVCGAYLNKINAKSHRKIGVDNKIHPTTILCAVLLAPVGLITLSPFFGPKSDGFSWIVACMVDIAEIFEVFNTQQKVDSYCRSKISSSQVYTPTRFRFVQKEEKNKRWLSTIPKDDLYSIVKRTSLA